MSNTPSQSSSLEDVMTVPNFPKIFKKGSLVKGSVVSVTKGQVLVDIGARAEGVVSGKEIFLEGEKRELPKVGDEILVYVRDSGEESGVPKLSIRKTGNARKWHELDEALAKDKSLQVEVIEANTGGVIVSVGGGLRGFIPTSQLDNARIYDNLTSDVRQGNSTEVQQKLATLVGQKIEVKIIEIDKPKNRIIFSEKLVKSKADVEQRAQTLKTVKVGDSLSGTVTGIAPFGLFVSAEGLEGLVHLSEISWDKVNNPGDFYRVNDKVKVQIIGLEDNGKRVAYSIKRMLKDPWDEIIKNYKVGQRVKGSVQKIADYGAFVRIADGVNGLIHISEISSGLVKDPSKLLTIGQELELEIISISKSERHLGLSLKRVLQEKEGNVEAENYKPKSQKKSKSEVSESATELESLKDITK
ncbi:MAG: S1 RNA-binding domain-containing protein [bacterium]